MHIHGERFRQERTDFEQNFKQRSLKTKTLKISIMSCKSTRMAQNIQNAISRHETLTRKLWLKYLLYQLTYVKFGLQYFFMFVFQSLK
jgi:hypothetical protein